MSSRLIFGFRFFQIFVLASELSSTNASTRSTLLAVSEQLEKITRVTIPHLHVRIGSMEDMQSDGSSNAATLDTELFSAALQLETAARSMRDIGNVLRESRPLQVGHIPETALRRVSERNSCADVGGNYWVQVTTIDPETLKARTLFVKVIVAQSGCELQSTINGNDTDIISKGDIRGTNISLIEEGTGTVYSGYWHDRHIYLNYGRGEQIVLIPEDIHNQLKGKCISVAGGYRASYGTAAHFQVAQEEFWFWVSQNECTITIHWTTDQIAYIDGTSITGTFNDGGGDFIGYFENSGLYLKPVSTGCSKEFWIFFTDERTGCALVECTYFLYNTLSELDDPNVEKCCKCCRREEEAESLRIVATQLGVEGLRYGEDPCSWEFMSFKECGNFGYSLLVPYRALQGSLSPMIGRLQGLNNLNLQANGIHGSLPTEMGQLSYLQNLNLNTNQFTGTIASEFGNLQCSGFVEFHTNQLRGSIPTELGKLSSTAFLYFGGNHLTGTIPTEIGQISLLAFLRFERNNFEGFLPTELGRLLTLQNLDVNLNPLLRCPEDTIYVGEDGKENYRNTAVVKSDCRCKSGSGDFNSAVTKRCLTCTAGRYRALVDPDDGCIACAKGSYVNMTGASTCLACTIGFAANESGLTMCSQCTAGRFSENAAPACFACKAGKFTPTSGRSFCQNCILGRYASEEATSECKSCSPLTTQLLGSSSQEDCVCQRGEYMDCATKSCEPCREGLHCPVAGLTLGSCGLNCSGDDVNSHMNPMLDVGYMSEVGSPLKILTCVDEGTCPSMRCLPTMESGMPACAEGIIGVRCARCPEGQYIDSEYSCKSCGVAGFGRIYRVGLVVFVSLATTAVMYAKATKKQTKGARYEFATILAALIPFIQQVMAFRSLEVEWPSSLTTPEFLRGLLSVSALFEFMQLPDPCVIGHDLVRKIIRNSCMPLLPFLNFAFFGVVFCLVGKRLQKDAIISVYLNIVCALFVTIAGMGVIMFPRQLMPDGSYFLKDLPDVEFGSKEWVSAVPISLITCVVYCGGVISYIAKAVYQAPRRAACEPVFVHRHEFMFEHVKSECWWWSLVELMFAATIALVQSLSDNLFIQVYCLVFIVVFMIVVLFRCMPFMSLAVNWTHIILKVVLLSFLLCITAMIDTSALTLDDYREAFGFMFLVLLVGVFMFLALLILGQCRHLFKTPGRHLGSTVKFTYKLRDVMQVVNMMPEADFLARVNHLTGMDREQLKMATNVLISVFLQQQPGNRIWQQRIVEDVPFKVWSYPETVKRSLTAMSSGEAHEALARNAYLRRNVQKLAKTLRNGRVSFTARAQKIFEVEDPTLWKKKTGLTFQKRIALSVKNYAEHAQLVDGQREIDEDEFVQRLEAVTGMEEKDLRAIFKLMDTDGSNTLSVSELVSALEGMAPEFADYDIDDTRASSTHASTCSAGNLDRSTSLLAVVAEADEHEGANHVDQSAEKNEFRANELAVQSEAFSIIPVKCPADGKDELNSEVPSEAVSLIPIECRDSLVMGL